MSHEIVFLVFNKEKTIGVKIEIVGKNIIYVRSRIFDKANSESTPMSEKCPVSHAHIFCHLQGTNYAIKKCVGMYDPLTKPFPMKRKIFQNISVMCTYFV